MVTDTFNNMRSVVKLLDPLSFVQNAITPGRNPRSLLTAMQLKRKKTLL